MEMNGRVNGEVDRGAEARARSARRHQFFFFFWSRTEISNLDAIHHWLTCY